MTYSQDSGKRKVIIIGEEETTLDPKELFDALYENAESLVCLLKDGNLIGANKKCSDFFGYGRRAEDGDQFIAASKIEPAADPMVFSFLGLTKKGIGVEGNLLLSEKINKEFYFGFLEITVLHGIDDYSIAITKIADTLSAMREIQTLSN